ncbi:pyridoxamine 5'-phosphate oxidase family protein [Noviherbaspirillum sp. CPCC 100848]|uniref:Pyridoxamine 5'-phosphate oxidase family protein n=1 Tax=Noviherbaspirillum album TaxID=3080276 RepID=A0ABU6JGM7_9BURK|nr:pyridoxamine 5'-phosphate oxidase family protein [Noviherbaspirillum sp. CPCC 100848]MEC4722568.1 pyridoxamine 5'-phosphate oxidase family protein [Noviherbaspirillum sp. CPCC 100848]
MHADNEPLHITDMAALERLYGVPVAASISKEIDHIHPHYRAFIEASPFLALATSGPAGLDVSPRGDPRGFVEIRDEKTLLLPDRRGNNRIDSLRNIVSNPNVALLFLIPGIGETLRVNGRARILIDPALLLRFAIDDKPPRSVLEIHVETVFFQCSRAILRSRLWDAAQHVERSSLPSLGTILQDLSGRQIDAKHYDSELPERLKTTIY